MPIQLALSTSDRITRRWVLALASAAALLVGLDTLVVSTALTTIRGDFDASPADLQWLVSAYTIVFAVLLLPASALGERFGRRRVFTAGLVLFVAASCACALSGGLGPLIAARALQGAGAAGVTPLALALVTAAFPPDQRAGALGVFAATMGVAVPLGPLVGGVLVHDLSWPWIFWLNIPLGLALALAARLRVPESVKTSAPLDGPGIVLVALGALGVVWALSRGDGSGWTSPEILTAGATGVLGTAAFLAREARARAPMLPLALFRSPQVAAGGATIFFLSASSFGAIYFMAQFFQSGQGLDALGAGVRMVAWGATTVVIPRQVGRLIPTYGEPVFVGGGTALHAGALLWFASAATPDRSYVWLVAPLVLSGAGCAMAIPAAQSLVLRAVDGPRIGAAAGAFSMLRQLGGAAGVAAAVAGFVAFGGYTSRTSFSRGFTAALLIGAALAVVAGVAGAAPLRSRARKQKTALRPTSSDLARGLSR